MNFILYRQFEVPASTADLAVLSNESALLLRLSQQGRLSAEEQQSIFTQPPVTTSQSIIPESLKQSVIPNNPSSVVSKPPFILKSQYSQTSEQDQTLERNVVSQSQLFEGIPAIASVPIGSLLTPSSQLPISIMPLLQIIPDILNTSFATPPLFYPSTLLESLPHSPEFSELTSMTNVVLENSTKMSCPINTIPDFFSPRKQSSIDATNTEHLLESASLPDPSLLPLPIPNNLQIDPRPVVPASNTSGSNVKYLIILLFNFIDVREITFVTYILYN